MKARCDDENRPQFKDWGGRGITYDPRWAVFENFLADMGEPPPGKTLDRRDNDGNYNKDNCRWTTPREQRLNSKRVHMITWEGRVQCIADWEREYGFSRGTLLMRMRRRMPLEAMMCRDRFRAPNAAPG